MISKSNFDNVANMVKKTLEQNIEEFLEVWNCEAMTSFLKDIIPLFELYDCNEENDWVRDAVGEEDELNVRLIRTVFLVSRIAEHHAGKLAMIRMRFGRLYKKMEKYNE